MSDNLYYCRTAVPENDGSKWEHAPAVAAATDHAIGQVKYLLKQAGEDFERGYLRVTESLDSHFEREYVIAEWVRK